MAAIAVTSAVNGAGQDCKQMWLDPSLVAVLGTKIRCKGHGSKTLRSDTRTKGRFLS